MLDQGDRAEIQRLRERAHQLEGGQAAILLRVQALEQWRTDHQRDADRIYGMVDALKVDHDTAQAVARALRGRARVELTWAQRAAGLVIFVLTVSDFVHRVWP